MEVIVKTLKVLSVQTLSMSSLDADSQQWDVRLGGVPLSSHCRWHLKVSLRALFSCPHGHAAKCLLWGIAWVGAHAVSEEAVTGGGRCGVC